MELSISGNKLKTLSRCITCLSRIGNEVSIQASPSLLGFHTLNPSRSAYQHITFKPDFFDVYTISANQVQCSLLLKAICSVLRTPLASIDRLSVSLPNPDASKVQWTLNCFNGMRKTYSITCNVEPDIQQLALDRTKLPSNFVVRPRDLNRLLGNFQSTLQEITIIATEPTSMPVDVANEIGGKAVELRSYIDPTKESDSSLHTQLWIDPTEEFVKYSHVGDPADITFGVKELKVFLSFCEGCEVDIHLYFDKAGDGGCGILTLRSPSSFGVLGRYRPILMVPKFGLDDGSVSNFDSTLVLATMLTSQLNEGNPTAPPPLAATVQSRASQGTGSRSQDREKENVSEHASDQTRIWSDLSGSGAKGGNGVEQRHVEIERNSNDNEHMDIHGISIMHISKSGPAVVNMAPGPSLNNPMETEHPQETQGREEIGGHGMSQRHPSNWVDADEDEDDSDEAELCVQSTPPYHEE